MMCMEVPLNRGLLFSNWDELFKIAFVFFHNFNTNDSINSHSNYKWGKQLSHRQGLLNRMTIKAN